MQSLTTTSRHRGSRYEPPRPDAVVKRDLFELLPAGRGLEEAQGRFFSDDGKKTPRTCFVVGDVAVLSGRAVAIVGAREMTSAGSNRARRLARELVAAGVTVVSGLAKGIDTSALSSALESGGRVAAVIGTPVDKAFPAENAALQERIYREHLLVSPFASGASVQKHFFPMRNRVMAALSDATVIVEASDTSGTLHQAAECQRLGRWLFIAKSVAEDATLTWPKRFLGQPRVEILSETNDLLRRLR